MQTYPEALMVSFQMTLGEFKVIFLLHIQFDLIFLIKFHLHNF